MLKNSENLITQNVFFYFCTMLKKFQIVLIMVVSLFLMLHQAYGQYHVNTFTETSSCCSASHKKENCCKKSSSAKTTSCKSKNCCSYTVSAPCAIMEPFTDFIIEDSFFLQQKTGNGTMLFVNSPLHSIWQPPKIRLNL